MAGLIDKSLDFFKNEIVFFISLILAIVSCFFVQPNVNYLDYINWDTIILLFAIMLIVEVLKNLTIFEILVRRLLGKIGSIRQLVLVLVFTCFISSIFITNDVSLIIFVLAHLWTFPMPSENLHFQGKQSIINFSFFCKAKSILMFSCLLI